jgi:flagellar biosynthesis protein FlhF
MRSEVFSGPDLRGVFEHARTVLGEDVVILRTDVIRRDGTPVFEVIAAPAGDVEAVQHRLSQPLPSLARGPRGRGDIGPFVVALVGPTGVGKTTTVTKLALSGSGFRNHKVGVLTLDTFRVGALEQISELTGLSGLALEVASAPRDVPRALARLDACDVVIVDTPGRSPRAHDLNAMWRSMLQIASPDETHLMIPATLRPTLMPPLCDAYAGCRPTHVLFTKVDELDDDASLGELAAAAHLPIRWLTVGQDIRGDLIPARGRVLAALTAARTTAAEEVAA